MSVNQTRLPIEKGYPERFELPDALTSWDVEVPHYEPPIYPDFTKSQQRLHEAGLDVATIEDLARLATLSNQQAYETYGPAAVEHRNPLGRTGINGTGIFWQAGESTVSDMGIYRRLEDGTLQVALVYNRGTYGLPGGFQDLENGEPKDHKVIALREAHEETGLDVSALDVQTLIPRYAKERSRRSADYGFIMNEVEVVMLPDPALGDGLTAADDAEKAGWFSFMDIEALLTTDLKAISEDHQTYILAGFRRFASA